VRFSSLPVKKIVFAACFSSDLVAVCVCVSVCVCVCVCFLILPQIDCCEHCCYHCCFFERLGRCVCVCVCIVVHSWEERPSR
jgi:hypothetical protein